MMSMLLKTLARDWLDLLYIFEILEVTYSNLNQKNHFFIYV
jgi:hypothetical protein